MNERIKELAEQAELYAVSDNSSMLFDVWKKRYTEKLAELIVKECADVAVKFHLAHPYSVEYQVKKHFGVE